MLGFALMAKSLSRFGSDGVSTKTPEQVAPLHRNISQGDVGDLAVFLCSDEAKNLTGNILFLDSGFHLMGLGMM